MKKFLHWLPRILSVIFILFISIFALDTLEDPQWYIALPIHLIPSFILLAVIILSWKNQKVGGISFILYGIGIFFFTNMQGYILAIPSVVIGALFLLDREKNNRS